MDRFFQAVLLFLVSKFAFADINIVDVRRNIPLSDQEPTYQDFYINGGTSDGLKKNLVVDVVRSMGIRDSSGAQSYGEISIPVAKVRILAAFAKVSVARLYQPLSREEFPMLEQAAIMNGDKIEIKGSFVDNKARNPQAISENTAATEVTSALPVAATTPAAPNPAAATNPALTGPGTTPLAESPIATQAATPSSSSSAAPVVAFTPPSKPTEIETAEPEEEETSTATNSAPGKVDPLTEALKDSLPEKLLENPVNNSAEATASESAPSKVQ